MKSKNRIEEKVLFYNNILRGIGIFEIIGGITGILLTISLMLKYSSAINDLGFILLFVLSFYSFSIWAGIRLFLKFEKEIRFSNILQFMQLFSFSFNGFTYILVSGSSVFIGFDVLNSIFEISYSLISSEFQINLFYDAESIFVKVNILAVAILVLLDRVENELLNLKDQLNDISKVEMDEASSTKQSE